MIHYVAIAGVPDVVERVRPLLRSALRDTAYMVGNDLEAADPAGTWAVSAVECADPMVSERMVIRDGSFTVFNGATTAARGSQSELSEGVFRAFSSGGASAITDLLRGVYNFVGATPEHGLEASSDFSAFAPLYWGQGEVAVFSNRSSTVRAVIGEQGWDVDAMAWLFGIGVLAGEATSAKGARRLLPHQIARVAPGQSRVVIEDTPGVWPATASTVRDDLTSEEWDAVTEDLVAGCRSLSTVDARLRINLTGGKDSRLVLSLLKAADLGDQVRAETRGLPNNPEVEAAAEVARVAGVEHRRVGPALPKASDAAPPPPVFDAEKIWRRIRQASYRFDALLVPWGGVSPLAPLKGTVVHLAGFLGEYYRGPAGADHQFRHGVPSDLDELASKLFNFKQKHDPLGLLRPEVVERHRTWVREWTRRTSGVVRHDLLPMRFYIDYRSGNWTGPMGQFTPGRIDINPLASEVAVSKVFESAPDVANTGRFHYEVMRRAAPELVSVPFLGDTWPEEIAASSHLDLPREAMKTTVAPTPRNLHTWQWQFLDQESEAIEALFAEAASTELSEVCDMKQLRVAARRKGDFKKITEAKSVMAAVGMSLTLLGRGEPVLDEPLTPPR